MNLSDIPTPLTDEAARKGTYFDSCDYASTGGKQLVHISFARDLERKLAEAQRENASALLVLGEVCGQLKKLRSQVEALKRKNAALREALTFYASSDTWFATTILADRPCGEIIDDFDESDDGRVRAGKRARATLAATEEKV